MSPVSATPDRSSMNGSVEYRALNVGFVPTSISDRMPAVGRVATDAIGIAGEFTLSTRSGHWQAAALWSPIARLDRAAKSLRAALHLTTEADHPFLKSR